MNQLAALVLVEGLAGAAAVLALRYVGKGVASRIAPHGPQTPDGNLRAVERWTQILSASLAVCAVLFLSTFLAFGAWPDPGAIAYILSVWAYPIFVCLCSLSAVLLWRAERVASTLWALRAAPVFLAVWYFVVANVLIDQIVRMGRMGW